MADRFADTLKALEVSSMFSSDAPLATDRARLCALARFIGIGIRNKGDAVVADWVCIASRILHLLPGNTQSCRDELSRELNTFANQHLSYRAYAETGPAQDTPDMARVRVNAAVLLAQLPVLEAMLAAADSAWAAKLSDAVINVRMQLCHFYSLSGVSCDSSGKA